MSIQKDAFIIDRQTLLSVFLGAAHVNLNDPFEVPDPNVSDRTLAYRDAWTFLTSFGNYRAIFGEEINDIADWLTAELCARMSDGALKT
jgi:hypothetical protein